MWILDNSANIGALGLAGLAVVMAAAWFLARRNARPWARRHRPAPRLALVEMRPVDSRRRLVLLRCDDREHLVLIGGAQDLVIQATL